MPLIPFYWFGGSLERYALLTAFDLALGLVLIVATTRQPSDPTTVDPRSRRISLQVVSIVIIALFMALVAAFLTIPIGMAAFIAATSASSDWWSLVGSPDVWRQVGVMALCAALRAHLVFVERTTVGGHGPASHSGPVVGDVAGDRRRSLADHAAQVTLVATFSALCFLLASVSGSAVRLLPGLFALSLVFYDARPDIARQMFPALWREK